MAAHFAATHCTPDSPLELKPELASAASVPPLGLRALLLVNASSHTDKELGRCCRRVVAGAVKLSREERLLQVGSRVG